VQDEEQLGVLLITHDRVLADTGCGEIADIRELSRGGGNHEAAAVEAPYSRASAIARVADRSTSPPDRAR
jgi:hypothetical protein